MLRTWVSVYVVIIVAFIKGSTAEISFSDVVAETLTECALQSTYSARCAQLLHRLGGDVELKGGDSSLEPSWRTVLANAVSRISWGMPECPVESKHLPNSSCNVSAVLSSFEQRPLLFHVVNDALNWIHFAEDAVTSCPDKCLWAGEVADETHADVLVFDCLQSPKHTPRRRDTLWLFLCMESEHNVPRMQNPAFLRQFDITATYRLSSDVPLLYAPGNLSLYKYADTQESKRRGQGGRGLVAWIASNCAPARLELVKALMGHVTVDSMGACLPTRPFPAAGPAVFGSEKIPLLAQYKFVLALENSLSDDYVSEKFYQPLIAGAVPLYLGAPNVASFAPSPHSYIDLRRFESVEEIGAYLKYLDNNYTAYAQYHAWRREALPAEFVGQASLGFNQGIYYGERDMRQDPCRLCQAARRRLDARRRAAGDGGAGGGDPPPRRV